MNFANLDNQAKLDLKYRLKLLCEELLSEKAGMILCQINDAQEAANNEDKSSAGDKHETSRALSQNTKDLNARILQEINIDITILNAVKINNLYSEVSLGSVVITPQNNFFIGVGCGTIKFEGDNFVTLSNKSPIALAMMGNKQGSKLIFNGRELLIDYVF